jgi:outer membrane assembly lipoprotein YfiO
MKYLILPALMISIILLNGCSSKTADDYMKAAQENIAQKQFPEAIENYKAVFENYPENPQAPEALSEMAKLNVSQKNIPEALKNYETVVKKYPGSSQAPGALFQIATLYQNKLIKNVSGVNSYERAEQTFRLVFDKYPDSDKAPMALFLSGFILANDLRNFEEATKTYNLFLEKYPEHELAASAKEELQNMGLSPDEILKKKAQKNI